MIELKSDQLWCYVKVWRHWNGTQWNWSVQFGEQESEKFTGIAPSRRAALHRAKKQVRKQIKRMVIVKLETSDFVQ